MGMRDSVRELRDPEAELLSLLQEELVLRLGMLVLSGSLAWLC